MRLHPGHPADQRLNRKWVSFTAKVPVQRILHALPQTFLANIFHFGITISITSIFLNFAFLPIGQFLIYLKWKNMGGGGGGGLFRVLTLMLVVGSLSNTK